MSKSRKVKQTKNRSRRRTSRRRTSRRKMTGGTNPNYNPVNITNLGTLIGHAKRFRIKADKAQQKYDETPNEDTEKEMKKTKKVADEKEEIIETFIHSFKGIIPRKNWKNENLTKEFDEVGTDWFSGKKNTQTGTERKGW